MAIWLFGPDVVDLPLRLPARHSVSFAHTGYHVLQRPGTDSFGAFRCGSLLDRFSQIDMLHLDVWWRGENVLVDSGSYLYNSLPRWHNYFLRTEVHNTVQVDGAQQMPHIRQFKTILPTKAALLRFEDTPGWSVCEGEHYGYSRNQKTASTAAPCCMPRRRPLDRGRHSGRAKARVTRCACTG